MQVDNNTPTGAATTAPVTPTTPVAITPDPVVVPPPVTPTTPIGTSDPTTTPPASKDNQMGLWLIIGVILVLVVVGGIYWFLSNQQAAQNSNLAPQVTMQPTTTERSLQEELNTINVQASGSSDFQEVETDLSGL